MFRSAEVSVQFAGHPPHSVGDHVTAVPSSDLCNVGQQQVFIFQHFFPTVFSLHQCCIDAYSTSEIQRIFFNFSSFFFFLITIIIVFNHELSIITNI